MTLSNSRRVHSSMTGTPPRFIWATYSWKTQKLILLGFFRKFHFWHLEKFRKNVTLPNSKVWKWGATPGQIFLSQKFPDGGQYIYIKKNLYIYICIILLHLILMYNSVQCSSSIRLIGYIRTYLGCLIVTFVIATREF